MTREIRRTVERLRFEAVHEYRPGVHEEVLSRIAKRAWGEWMVWQEYERLAENRAGEWDRSRPLVNHTLNDINAKLTKEFFQ